MKRTNDKDVSGMRYITLEELDLFESSIRTCLNVIADIDSRLQHASSMDKPELISKRSHYGSVFQKLHRRAFNSNGDIERLQKQYLVCK